MSPRDLVALDRRQFAAPSPLDMRVGDARVPWGRATPQTPVLRPGPCSTWRQQSAQPSGWVLPGGERTADRERAERVAFNINLMIITAGRARTT